MWRIVVGLAFVMVAPLLGVADTGSAHEFNAPEVSVQISDRTPGGHPDLQTTIRLDEGATFDEVRVVGPPGGSIAADLDIPDGAIVGRLDGVATTNAITLPDCGVTSPFAVTIREATTESNSPDYPPYLNELAPGKHRLRLVADVSPSPDVPVLINYLFEIDEVSGSVISHTIVGNPLAPPPQFRTCTPSTSTVTLFGVSPVGYVLLTNPDPAPQTPLPFTYTFTSRPDDDGHRHEETVEATAAVGAIDRGEPPPPPRDLRLLLFGVTGRLEWAHDGPVESFVVEVLTTNLTGEGHQILEPFSVPGSERSFFIDTPQLPSGCDESVFYRVAAVYAGGTGTFTATEPISACVEGPENPSPPVTPPLTPPDAGLTPPDAGSGPARADLTPAIVAALLALVGSGAALAGLTSRRR